MSIEKSNSQVISDAKQIVLTSNSFTFHLTKVFINKNRLPYFFCWYAYFRSVDDLADSNLSTLEYKTKFIFSQIELINSLYLDHSNFEQSHAFESYLHELIKYDKRCGTIIKPFLIDMLNCIRFDVSRLKSHSSKLDLDTYFSKEVLSYLNTFNFFCCTSGHFFEIKRSTEGISGKWVHILRDFIKDTEDNIYNLPKEDIVSFNIDTSNLNILTKSNNFKSWVSNKMEQIKIGFKGGKKELKKQYSWKYKMIVLILCFKYQLYCNSINKDNYNLERNYKIAISKIIFSSPRLIVEVLTFSIHHLLTHKLRLLSVK